MPDHFESLEKMCVPHVSRAINIAENLKLKLGDPGKWRKLCLCLGVVAKDVLYGNGVNFWTSMGASKSDAHELT